jgi:hypothetical protein
LRDRRIRNRPRHGGAASIRPGRILEAKLHALLRPFQWLSSSRPARWNGAPGGSGARGQTEPSKASKAMASIVPSRRRKIRVSGAPRQRAGSKRMRMSGKAKRGAGRRGAEGAGRLDPLDQLRRRGAGHHHAVEAQVARGPVAPAPCRARSSVSRSIAGSSCARVKDRPAAIRWPPPFSIRPSAASFWIDAPRSTPETDRPEPLPSIPVEADHHGGAVRVPLSAGGDDAHDARMPAVAGGPDQRRVQPAASACASAASRTRASISRRSVLSVSSLRARAWPRRGRSVEQARTEIGRADPATGIDPGAEDEAQMVARWARGQPRHVASATRPLRWRRAMTVSPAGRRRGSRR